jgi:hypothetical protein
MSNWEFGQDFSLDTTYKYCSKAQFLGFSMSWILKERWFWIIVVAAMLIVTLPFLILILLLNLPPILSFVTLVLILIAWGIVAGYRDWLRAGRKEGEGASKGKS